MEKEIKINTDRKKFFRQYVEILKPICKLRGRDADVLAELLYQSYIRKDINSLSDRFRLIFDYNTKMTICEELNMGIAGFGNSLTQLRRKGVIGKGNVINPGYLINPDDDIVSIKYSFMFPKE